MLRELSNAECFKHLKAGFSEVEARTFRRYLLAWHTPGPGERSGQFRERGKDRQTYEIIAQIIGEQPLLKMIEKFHNLLLGTCTIQHYQVSLMEVLHNSMNTL